MTPESDLNGDAMDNSVAQRNHLTTDIVVRSGVVEMTVHGELDMSTVGLMSDRAAVQLAAGTPSTLVLDFSGVTFCDSAGANGLIRLRNECDRMGWNFQLTGLQGHVRRVLVDLMGLGGVLNVPPAT